jgi:hypothetical protein
MNGTILGSERNPELKLNKVRDGTPKKGWKTSKIAVEPPIWLLVLSYFSASFSASWISQVCYGKNTCSKRDGTNGQPQGNPWDFGGRLAF